MFMISFDFPLYLCASVVNVFECSFETVVQEDQ